MKVARGLGLGRGKPISWINSELAMKKSGAAWMKIIMLIPRAYLLAAARIRLAAVHVCILELPLTEEKPEPSGVPIAIRRKQPVVARQDQESFVCQVLVSLGVCHRQHAVAHWQRGVRLLRVPALEAERVVPAGVEEGLQHAQRTLANRVIAEIVGPARPFSAMVRAVAGRLAVPTVNAAGQVATRFPIQ